MIVMKFGGTSNKDAAAMANVISIVKAHLKEQPVVVISAIAQATNELEQTARTAAEGNAQDARAILDRLFARHDEIIARLIKTTANKQTLTSALRKYRSEIERLIDGVAILRELTPRSMDAFCSYGERLSSRIVAMGLQESGVDAEWVDAKEFMVTDDNFGNARPIMEIVEDRLGKVIKPLLKAGNVPVTQGFIGVTRSGVYTTMGRESSDYSASIIGAAMNAARVQIWTDVDGILTADPNMVQGIKKISRLSFGEAFELSYFGAKVLHPNTMLPVIDKRIPVQILNSMRSDGTGTIVDANTSLTDGAHLKSIAYMKGLAMVTVRPTRRLGQFLFWEGVFSVLNKHSVMVGMTAASEYSLSFTVDAKRLTAGMLDELKALGEVDVFDAKASLCLVGRGLRGSSGIMDRVFGALRGVNISLVSFGASDMNVVLVVDEPQVAAAVNSLHNEFFVADTEHHGAAPIFEATA